MSSNAQYYFTKSVLMDIVKHLGCVLSSHNIENDETLMTAYRNKRDEVQSELEKKYGPILHGMLHSGSYKKKLAINIKFDMDLVMAFSKDCGKTLQELFEEVFSFFETEYRRKDSSLIQVKRQKVAIGLEFLVDGKILDLDIVPGREIDNYPKDGYLNVYISEKMGSFTGGSWLQTNIAKQIEQIRENALARPAIKLMKVWKRTNNGSIKSFVLELAAIKALEGYSGPQDNWSLLKTVMVFIRDKITTVRLVDPGNSANVVSDSLEAYQKQQISESISWILKSIEKDPETIKTFFPVNRLYPCKEEKNRAYIVGAGGVDKLNDQDFG